MSLTTGVAKVKNISASPYTIEELGGHVLAVGAELDLMDTALPQFYENWEAAKRALESTATKIYQDINAVPPKIQIVELSDPVVTFP